MTGCIAISSNWNRSTLTSSNRTRQLNACRAMSPWPLPVRPTLRPCSASSRRRVSSTELVYDRGSLTRALIRGDGTHGEDVTAKAPPIPRRRAPHSDTPGCETRSRPRSRASRRLRETSARCPHSPPAWSMLVMSDGAVREGEVCRGTAVDRVICHLGGHDVPRSAPANQRIADTAPDERGLSLLVEQSRTDCLDNESAGRSRSIAEESASATAGTMSMPFEK